MQEVSELLAVFIFRGLAREVVLELIEVLEALRIEFQLFWNLDAQLFGVDGFSCFLLIVRFIIRRHNVC